MIIPLHTPTNPLGWEVGVGCGAVIFLRFLDETLIIVWVRFLGLHFGNMKTLIIVLNDSAQLQFCWKKNDINGRGGRGSWRVPWRSAPGAPAGVGPAGAGVGY